MNLKTLLPILFFALSIPRPAFTADNHASNPTSPELRKNAEAELALRKTESENYRAMLSSIDELEMREGPVQQAVKVLKKQIEAKKEEKRNLAFWRKSLSQLTSKVNHTDDSLIKSLIKQIEFAATSDEVDFLAGLVQTLEKTSAVKSLQLMRDSLGNLQASNIVRITYLENQLSAAVRSDGHLIGND